MMLKRIRAETILLFVSLFALGTAFAFQRIRSLDYWWHLRTGALIAESGAVPTADPYTYTVPGAPWIDIRNRQRVRKHRGTTDSISKRALATPWKTRDDILIGASDWRAKAGRPES